MNNPDPGHYYKPKKWNEIPNIEKTLLKYKAHEHKPLAVIPSSKAPGIPSKKLAQTAYTGFGMDQVGPAAYNPKVTETKFKSTETNFTISGVKRETFEVSPA